MVSARILYEQEIQEKESIARPLFSDENSGLEEERKIFEALWWNDNDDNDNDNE